jgi:cytochrome c550
MNRNPLIPFAFIAAIGLLMMFIISFVGLDNMHEIAAGGEEDKDAAHGETVAATPEELYNKSCISCHGDQMQGGIGPKLTDVGSRLSVDEIKNVLANGQGAMPAGLVPADKLDEMATWLSEMK